ncbi:hypothetical protein [Streptomyces sp. NPDC048603]|uniref:hypothetical protein n=1 Tax=Streptomyces sp. NPDC048603 TaxID=3365577 RepID=UPI00371AFEBA
MRRRLLGFTAAVILAALGPIVPVAHATVVAQVPPPPVDGQMCEDGGGVVLYDSGSWVCVGGAHDGKPVV